MTVKQVAAVVYVLTVSTALVAAVGPTRGCV